MDRKPLPPRWKPDDLILLEVPEQNLVMNFQHLLLETDGRIIVFKFGYIGPALGVVQVRPGEKDSQTFRDLILSGQAKTKIPYGALATRAQFSYRIATNAEVQLLNQPGE